MTSQPSLGLITLNDALAAGYPEFIIAVHTIGKIERDNTLESPRTIITLSFGSSGKLTHIVTQDLEEVLTRIQQAQQDSHANREELYKQLLATQEALIDAKNEIINLLRNRNKLSA